MSPLELMCLCVPLWVSVPLLFYSCLILQIFTRTHTRSGMQRVWFDRKILDLSGKNVCKRERGGERERERERESMFVCACVYVRACVRARLWKQISGLRSEMY
jgi:hypothetical protein